MVSLERPEGNACAPLGPVLAVPEVRGQRLAVPLPVGHSGPPAQSHAEGAPWPQGRTGRLLRVGGKP